MGQKITQPKLIDSTELEQCMLNGAHKVDAYSELLEDLFLIRNPKYKFEKDYKKDLKKFVEEHCAGKDIETCGSWFLFPWNNFLVHFLDDELHQELRTARNKNLITAEEQGKLRNLCIAFAGMSVGSHCALTINMMGMARHMKIADPDVLSGSNMNRVRYDFTKVGKKKSAVAREHLYQMDPYSIIDEFSDGVTSENVSDFFEGVDILVEETDNLETKIFLREESKKRGIPVVMATDNGDGVIVDIERYDLDKNTKLFNGLIGDITLDEFKNFPAHELPKLASKIAGLELIVPRMLESLALVGKSLYSWPQLGDAATLSGVVVAYAVKQIALGFPIHRGKIDINLDNLFAEKLEE